MSATTDVTETAPAPQEPLPPQPIHSTSFRSSLARLHRDDAAEDGRVVPPARATMEHPSCVTLNRFFGRVRQQSRSQRSAEGLLVITRGMRLARRVASR
ncbi:hypothetical protein V5735_15990 (plasmid) [Haladaptatus sp. SPP-AMP-3]|uniref:hypothetical protein n=1 Tax=Haladaptatus sp. SPP-AMP-3 TaxID=3121295 RepID=UPI003C2B67B1